MFRIISLLIITISMASAAERSIDFIDQPLQRPPKGFTGQVTGGGPPSEWKVIEAAAPTLLPPISPNAPVPKKPVVAQLSEDPTDERFPLLIYESDPFSDFKVTTHFKTVKGTNEQMAGIAFRIQDEKNYYVVRASSLGNSFWFYKFVNGQRALPVGVEVPVPSGVWHELTVECKGNQILCWLDGKQPLPAITDSTFLKGKVGLWTKSDSVTYFSDLKINYTPAEILAQILVRDALKQFPRILGMKIFGYQGTNFDIGLIASQGVVDDGVIDMTAEQNAMNKGVLSYAKGKEHVIVVAPLRDKNGETVAAIRINMKSFPGQTEENALARTIPITRSLEDRIQSGKDLME